ncbi:MAG: hypothetical protein ACPG5P_09665, partial [Saprospiraceae bacterium]
FVDPNEAISVVESICVVSCEEDRSSTHTTSWGCDGSICEAEVVNNFVAIGVGSANPVSENSGTIPNMNTGYCQDGVQTVTFTNEGNEIDAGFGTMLDVEIGMGLGNSFLLESGGYEIFSMTIAGVSITAFDSLNLLDGNPLFLGVDPDGAGGLTDADGDGYFDDLPINESIEISIGYRLDCTETLETDDNCRNNMAETVNSQIHYSDACDNRLIRRNNSIIRPSNIRPDYENSTDTDADIVVETFTINHYQRRTLSNFEKSCGDGEQILVTLDLPVGVVVDLAASELTRNINQIFPVLSSNLTSNGTGTTLELVYDASVSTEIKGEYNLNLVF